MGVDPSTLKLRIVSTDIQMSPVKTYEHMTYEVFHDASGAIVATNKLAGQVETSARIQEVDSYLYNRCLVEYAEAQWQFGSNASLGGYSPYDVSLMLEYWSFERQGTNWKLTHPLSGSFSNVAIPGTPFPTIINRASAIIARVLPPSTWGWASAPSAGHLEAHCVAVTGATSYNIYHDKGNGTFALLGTAATAAGATLTVPAGYYRVRMAGVKTGVVGVLGHPVQVTVL